MVDACRDLLPQTSGNAGPSASTSGSVFADTIRANGLQHFDGYFSREIGERSQLTFMVYLNADFTGGETRFYNDDREVRLAVRPEPGMASIFVHLPLHEGAPVVNGRKYVLRTDVMYTSPTQHE